MVWCYSCLVSFVDWINQLRSVGEQYVMSLMRLLYDLLLCGCVIVMSCLCFQLGGRRMATVKVKKTSMASGQKVNWLWQVALVSKNLYLYLSVAY